MSHEFEDERSATTGLPTNHRVVLEGPWERRRFFWYDFGLIALSFFAGLLIGHAL